MELLWAKLFLIPMTFSIDGKWDFLKLPKSFPIDHIIQLIPLSVAHFIQVKDQSVTSHKI
jgi:hypothetical protein